MAFSLPADLATNWADNVGMIENATYLNAVGAMLNAEKAALNAWINGATGAVVATSETTTSASYTDLTTTTDTVTVTVGNSGTVLVLLQSLASNTGGTCYIGFALSSGNTVAASDSYAVIASSHSSGVQQQTGSTFLVTGLAAGSTVFKMKYKVSAGTGTFANRRIAVIPFP